MAESFKVADAFVEITATDNTAEGRARAEQAVRNIRGGTVKIDADIRSLEAELRRADARLTELRNKRTSPKVDADIQAAEAALRRVDTRLDTLRAKRTSPKVELDIQQAEAKRAQIEAKLNGLKGKKYDPRVEADIAAAEAGIAQLQLKLAALRDKRVKVHVDSEGATSGLRRVASAAASALNPVQKLGGTRLPNISGSLIAGLLAIPAAAGVAAAAIAAIPAAGAALGGIGSVFLGSFSGIGDALKAHEKMADAPASKSGGGGDNGARARARAIRDATQAIDDARREQARTAIDTAEQIADAERTVQDAVRNTARAQAAVKDAEADATRVRRDQARQVKAAEEAVTEARQNAAKAAKDSARDVAQAQRGVVDAEHQAAQAAERAADAVSAAERRVEAAQTQSRRAQQALNDARREAIRQLAELAERASDAARDEIGASLSLQRARERLTQVNNDALSTDLDKAEAAYEVTVAEDRLSDAQRENADAQRENAAAQARGVELSKDVLSAKEQVADAHQAEVDAAKDLTDAQRDAAESAAESAQRIADAQGSLALAQERAADQQVESQRRIQDAVDNLTQARERQAEANESAQQRIADAAAGVEAAQRSQEDAERNLATARRHASEQQEDAARRVADAMQGLSDAQEKANTATGSSGTSAADKYGQALAKLTPLQRDLVKELLHWQDIMDGLKKTASDAFLPGFIKMLKDAETLVPTINGFLQRTGTIMGETASKMGDLFKSESFRTNLDLLLKSTEPIVRAIGNLLVDMTGKVVEFGAHMGPAADGVAKFIDSVSKGFQGFLDSLTPHAKSFGSIWESLGRIMEVLLPILGRVIGKMADELAPILEKIAGWLERNQGQIGAFGDKLGEWLPTIGAIILGIKGFMAVMEFTKIAAALRLIGNLTLAFKLAKLALKAFGLDAEGIVDRISGAFGRMRKGGGVKENLLGPDGCKSTRGCLDEVNTKLKGTNDELDKTKKKGGLKGALGLGGGEDDPDNPGGGKRKKQPGKLRRGAKKVGRGALLVGGIGAVAGAELLGGGSDDDTAAEGDDPNAMKPSLAQKRAHMSRGDMGHDAAETAGQLFSFDFGGVFDKLRADTENFPQQWDDAMKRLGISTDDFLGVLSRNFGEIPGKVWGWLSDTATKIGEKLTEWVTTANTKTAEFVTGINTWVSELPGKVWGWLSEMATKAAEKLTEWVTTANTKTAEFVTGINTWVSELPGKVWGWLSEMATKARDKLTEWANTAREKASEVVNKITEFITQLPGKVGGWFTDVATRAREKLTEWATTAREKASEIVQRISEFISQLPGKISTWFTDTVNRARDRLTEWATIARTKAGEIVDGIINWVKDLPSKVGTVFQNMKDWAIRELNALKDMAATPIRFVVDTVYEHGIKPVWNGIATVFSLPRLATGGIMPGYTPGRDVHLAALSGGEAVMRPEWTRAAGKQYIDGANKAARVGGVAGAESFIARNGLPGYSLGGIVGDLWNMGASWVGDLWSKGVNSIRSLFDAVIGDNNRTPGSASLWRSAAMQPAPRAVDGAVAMAKKWMDSGAGNYGRGLSYAKSQVGQPYVWASAGPNGFDCSGFMSAITNVIRGKSPNSRVGSTASFPWGGFQVGHSSPFMIGSTPNYGGSGTGHMAGTLLGTNVESRGGKGVVVGSGARGVNDGGFSVRAGMTADTGGLLPAGMAAFNNGARAERVLSADQSERFERLVSSPLAGGVTVNLHVNGVLDFREKDTATRQIVSDLRDQLVALERSFT